MYVSKTRKSKIKKSRKTTKKKGSKIKTFDLEIDNRPKNSINELVNRFLESKKSNWYFRKMIAFLPHLKELSILRHEIDESNEYAFSIENAINVTKKGGYHNMRRLLIALSNIGILLKVRAYSGSTYYQLALSTHDIDLITDLITKRVQNVQLQNYQ